MQENKELLNTSEGESLNEGHSSEEIQKSQETSRQETPVQGTPQDWEKRYKDLQAYATRLAQERKELEERLSQIEAHFQRQRQLTREQQIEQFKKEFIKDPVGTMERLKQEIRQEILGTVTPVVLQQRILDFRERHRDEFPDEATFEKVGTQLASIIREYGLANSRDPLEAAYRIWKGQNVTSELRKQIEEEVKRKMGYTESEAAGMPQPTPEDEEEWERIKNAKPGLPF